MIPSLSEIHAPVLENEILEYLDPANEGLYVDGTLGLGGHSSAILEKSKPNGMVIGFEWDEEAARLAARRLARYQERFTIIHESYANILSALQANKIDLVDGLVLDLGVSSLQLDRGERGFSFRVDAPLDMRMDTGKTITAAHLIERLSQEELADIFYNYGEERQSRRIAAHLVQLRAQQPITTTRELAEAVATAVPKKFHPKKIHMATKVFQALRIAVNSELDNVVKVLGDAPHILRPGAAVCVITFHSLEDRITKRAFAANPLYRVVTRKPVKPTQEEIAKNPRARSAKLRVAIRCP